MKTQHQRQRLWCQPDFVHEAAGEMFAAPADVGRYVVDTGRARTFFKNVQGRGNLWRAAGTDIEMVWGRGFGSGFEAGFLGGAIVGGALAAPYYRYGYGYPYPYYGTYYGYGYPYLNGYRGRYPYDRQLCCRF